MDPSNVVDEITKRKRNKSVHGTNKSNFNQETKEILSEGKITRKVSLPLILQKENMIIPKFTKEEATDKIQKQLQRLKLQEKFKSKTGSFLNDRFPQKVSILENQQTQM
jgi:hypothetical protein